MSFIPRNLLNEFYGYAVQEELVTTPNTPYDDDEQFVATFAALSIEDLQVPPIASSLGKRKWCDTDMSTEKSHERYCDEDEDVQKHPVFTDYLHRYVNIIPGYELEEGEIVEYEEDTRMDVVEDEENEYEEDTRMDVVEDEDEEEEEDDDCCLGGYPVELEDGEIYEPPAGSCYVVVDELP